MRNAHNLKGKFIVIKNRPKKRCEECGKILRHNTGKRCSKCCRERMNGWPNYYG